MSANDASEMVSNDGATVHVAFGQAAGGSIRAAMERVGRRERVIGLPDDLSFGPINPPRSDLRRAWARSVLRQDCYAYEGATGTADAFWADATAPEAITVAWVCMTDAAEHAGFLEFVWRMVGRPFDIVDATGIKFLSKRYRDGIARPWSLGVMSPEQIVDGGLYERRAAFPDDQAALARAEWRDLREENAPFRVLEGGRLVSAPLTRFDGFLQQYATTDWQVAARLIGETMGRMDLDMGLESPSDSVLLGRMIALGEAGQLDVEGSGPNMRDYRVRRMAFDEKDRAGE